MNHASTVSQRDIVVARHIEGLLMLPLAGINRAVKERLIFLIFQVFSLIPLQHLVSGRSRFLVSQAPQHGIQKGFRHIIGKAVRSLHLHIGFIRVHTQSHIRRQCPGRCGPCQDISILPFYLKTGDGRAFLHILIALRHLMGRKRRPAARAVRHNLKALIQKALVPDLL